jgi:hypothetical protein
VENKNSLINNEIISYIYEDKNNFSSFKWLEAILRELKNRIDRTPIKVQAINIAGPGLRRKTKLK